MGVSKMTRNFQVSAAAGLWKDLSESGVRYERRVRRGWPKRLRRELR